MLSARQTVSVRRLTLRPAQHLAARSKIANLRSYVTSPLTPDPHAKPAAADLPVKPAHDKLPFAAPSNTDETQGQLGQVKLPDMDKIEYEADQDLDVRIPTAPDTYRSAETSPDAPSDPVGHAPQVATASHSSTYHGGGPSLNKAGQDGDVVVDQHSEGERNGKGKGERKNTDAESASQDGEDQKSHKYEWKDRRLDADEKRGLYLIGGMLVGGYVLSTLTERKSVQHKH